MFNQMKCQIANSSSKLNASSSLYTEFNNHCYYFLHLISYQGVALLEKVILKFKSSAIWTKEYAGRKCIVINQVVQQVNFQNIILIAGQSQTEQLHQRFHWMKYRIQTGEQVVTLLGLNHSRHRLDTLSHLYSFK